ncbi:hypothetical protein [Collimonas antrihumi]|uniref:hypothetical protein n=1 Tax=Collimonas antrihumi TaxID=1940615 RepID=UPI001B8D9403|nr:hypothetical protein [Collimonas antrihumi]
MSQNFEHNGAHYSVDVTEAKRDEWTWWYRLADGRTGSIGDRPLRTEALAIDEAKNAAEFRIDGK